MPVGEESEGGQKYARCFLHGRKQGLPVGGKTVLPSMFSSYFGEMAWHPRQGSGTLEDTAVAQAKKFGRAAEQNMVAVGIRRSLRKVRTEAWRLSLKNRRCFGKNGFFVRGDCVRGRVAGRAKVKDTKTPHGNSDEL